MINALIKNITETFPQFHGKKYRLEQGFFTLADVNDLTASPPTDKKKILGNSVLIVRSAVLRGTYTDLNVEFKGITLISEGVLSDILAGLAFEYISTFDMIVLVGDIFSVHEKTFKINNDKTNIILTSLNIRYTLIHPID
jgi:hypothetical protein